MTTRRNEGRPRHHQEPVTLTKKREALPAATLRLTETLPSRSALGPDLIALDRDARGCGRR
jgi:hypothetical protein